MSSTLLDTQIHELTDDARIIVEKHADYDCDFTDGEFTAKFSEYVIDRVNGIFYGECIGASQCPLCAGAIPQGDEQALWDDDSETEEYTRPCPHCNKSLVISWRCDYWLPVELVAEFDTDNIKHGYHILAHDLTPTAYDPSREYRYFKPEQYPEPGEAPGEGYTVEYVFDDWKRAEQLNRGEWGYIGYIVKVQVDKWTVGKAVQWGIESDCDDSDMAGVVENLIDEAWGSVEDTGKRVAQVVALGTIDAGAVARQLAE